MREARIRPVSDTHPIGYDVSCISFPYRVFDAARIVSIRYAYPRRIRYVSRHNGVGGGGTFEKKSIWRNFLHDDDIIMNFCQPRKKTKQKKTTKTIFWNKNKNWGPYTLVDRIVPCHNVIVVSWQTASSVPYPAVSAYQRIGYAYRRVQGCIRATIPGGTVVVYWLYNSSL